MGETHTGRMIAVVILAIIALSLLMSGHMMGTLFWGLLALAVAYPFIAHKSLTYNSKEPIVVYATPPPPGYAPPAM